MLFFLICSIHQIILNNNKKMYHAFHKNIKQHNCFQQYLYIFFTFFNNDNKTCFLSTKSALEWFLKDHVTLKTGVMVHYVKMKYILKYIKTETIILNCKNIFDQINAALVSIRDLFQKH